MARPLDAEREHALQNVQHLAAARRMRHPAIAVARGRSPLHSVAMLGLVPPRSSCTSMPLLIPERAASYILHQTVGF